MEVASEKVVNRDVITDAALSTFAGDYSTDIPESYIGTDEVLAAEVVVGEDVAYELPVVDMAKLLDPDSSAMETEKLGYACRHWGFFQLTNHGVDEAVAQLIKDTAVQFFSFPLDLKNRVAVPEKGAGIEGYGHHYSRGPGDKLDWAEGLILITQPVQERNMNLWPTNPPAFRDALAAYSMEMTKLARRLLGFMAADLGVDPEALLGAFHRKRQSSGVHRYPPCRRPEKVLGMIPHTDGFGLTLLLHADDTPGLQVRRRGMWFPVRPLPGALVVNVGDVLQVLSNGVYGSAEHRVIPHAERSRTTVVVFQDASLEGEMVAPLPELLRRGDEPRYRSVERLEFSKGHLRELAQGTQFLDSLKISSS